MTHKEGAVRGRRGMTAYRCPGCGYIYDEAKGDPREGFPAGKPFSESPTTGVAPTVPSAKKSISSPTMR